MGARRRQDPPNPALLVPVVRVPRGRPRPIHETAYRHALATSSGRERLAIRLAGQCGLRRTEVAELARAALEETLAGWSLRVVGKGGHVRMVPVLDDLAAEILRHPAGWLFPSPHGGHLTPAHLGKIVARRLPGAFATHSLRHRAASVGYAGTRDLRAVQELLGHASPETTAIYTAVPDTWIRAAMLAAA
ncbi:MAG: tyrosine-type recombinase/integrase [Actinomycetales bacterium]|nr:tyrosine-type recombinase/integrase [Actinomycetales bacterium]